MRLVGNGIKNYGSGVADVLTSCTENIFEKLCTFITNFLGNVYKYYYDLSHSVTHDQMRFDLQQAFQFYMVYILVC